MSIRLIKHVLTLALWAVLTLGLSRWWLTNPNIGPNLPQPVWLWLDGWYGSKNAEDVADLELLVALVLMGLVSAVLIFLLKKSLWFINRIRGD